MGDTLTGLRPVTSPNLVHELEAAETIYRYCPVKISGGKVSRADATTDVAVGVALGYAAAGDRVSFCEDDEQLYSVLATGGLAKSVIAASIPGTYVAQDGATAGTGDADTLLSDLTVDETTSSATYVAGTGTRFYVVDLDRNVAQPADAATSGVRLIVKVRKPDIDTDT